MTYREKVIKAIETHISTDDSVGCDDCTYENDGWCMTRVLTDALALLKEQGHKDKMFHALEDDWKQLKELLKEQEAVEPTLIREGRNKNYNDYVCPRCDNVVVYEQNYCSECGVRYLWKGR